MAQSAEATVAPSEELVLLSDCGGVAFSSCDENGPPLTELVDNLWLLDVLLVSESQSAVTALAPSVD